MTAKVIGVGFCLAIYVKIWYTDSGVRQTCKNGRRLALFIKKEGIFSLLEKGGICMVTWSELLILLEIVIDIITLFVLVTKKK